MTLINIADSELRENWDANLDLFTDFSQAFDTYLDIKESLHLEERKAGVHASEITGCLRAAAYTVLGTEKKGTIPKSWRNKFNHGHYIHAGVQHDLHSMARDWGTRKCKSVLRDMVEAGLMASAKLERYDFTLTFSHEVKVSPEMSPVAATWDIHSSCDGVISFFKKGEFEEEEMVARLGLEIKSASGSSYAKITKPSKAHIEQAHVYMRCLDLPATWLLYYNKENENTTPSQGQFLVPYDPCIWQEVASRIERLYQTIESEELPSQDTGIWCSWCRYRWTCAPPNGFIRKNDNKLLTAQKELASIWLKEPTKKG